MHERALWTAVRRGATCGAAVFLACGVGGCQGEGRGLPPWRAEYFENRTLAGQPHFTRYHRAVDFNWVTGAPLESWVEDDFSIRWETCMRVERLARVTFRLASDDGARLYIDEDRIVDNWGEHGFDGGAVRTVVLNPGTYPLRVEYFEGTGFARIQLSTSIQPLEAVEWVPLPTATDEPDGGMQSCSGGGGS
ncbi:MAG: PA14 domain-containing protein [Acidobacteria bacterium]|nr:PA14 domain-containing protein [Acidobacteriota bacterium]